MNEKKLLSVRVPSEYAEEVKEFAYKRMMNISDLIRAALEKYMEEEK